MRVFLAVLILTFGFQSWTKADDIRDFQIEGMSIGDSLLDHFSEDEIINGIKHDHVYKSDKFYDVEIYSHKKFETYQNIQFGLKKNDKEYIVYVLTGFNFYEENVDKCLNKVDEVSNEISPMFTEATKKSGYINHKADKSGKSKVKYVDFIHKSGVIYIECFDWSEEITKKNNWMDNFGIGIKSDEYNKWASNEAYN